MDCIKLLGYNNKHCVHSAEMADDCANETAQTAFNFLLSILIHFIERYDSNCWWLLGTKVFWYATHVKANHFGISTQVGF